MVIQVDQSPTNLKAPKFQTVWDKLFTIFTNNPVTLSPPSTNK